VKLGNCGRLKLQPIHGIWFRAIATRYWKAALQTSHTAQTATRFNSGGASGTPYEILYLADSQVVALSEVGAIFGPPSQPVSNPAQSRMVPIDVHVTLRGVADLTDKAEQAILDISTQLLTGNWDTYENGDAPTQQLGAALFATSGVEGFLAISGKMPRCKTLIVFPKKLLNGSEIVFRDTISRRGKTHRIAP
jgi:RES domain